MRNFIKQLLGNNELTVMITVTANDTETVAQWTKLAATIQKEYSCNCTLNVEKLY